MSKWLSQRHIMPLSLSWQQEHCVFVEQTRRLKCSANKMKRLVSVLQHKRELVLDDSSGSTRLWA